MSKPKGLTKAQVDFCKASLLFSANCYEPKKRKYLVGIRWDLKNMTARWSGHAHNYTENIPEAKPRRTKKQ